MRQGIETPTGRAESLVNFVVEVPGQGRQAVGAALARSLANHCRQSLRHPALCTSPAEARECFEQICSTSLPQCLSMDARIHIHHGSGVLLPRKYAGPVQHIIT
jgi:hypothetical protein